MKKKLYIEGMCCCKCPHRIKEGLLNLEGIISVEVNSSDNTAIVEFENQIEDDTLSVSKIENL